jgi:hypothetical protein
MKLLISSTRHRKSGNAPICSLIFQRYDCQAYHEHCQVAIALQWTADVHETANVLHGCHHVE